MSISRQCTSYLLACWYISVSNMMKLRDKDLKIKGDREKQGNLINQNTINSKFLFDKVQRFHLTSSYGEPVMYDPRFIGYVGLSFPQNSCEDFGYTLNGDEDFCYLGCGDYCLNVNLLEFGKDGYLDVEKFFIKNMIKEIEQPTKAFKQFLTEMGTCLSEKGKRILEKVQYMPRDEALRIFYNEYERTEDESE